MMSCLDEDQIVALEEQLGRDPHEVIRHLASCDTCKRSLDDAIELRRLLTHEVPIDAAEVERVVTTLREEYQPTLVGNGHGTGLLEVALGTGVAVALLALVNGGAVWTGGPSTATAVAGLLVSMAWAITIHVSGRPARRGASL
jgi:hypothetical protein